MNEYGDVRRITQQDLLMLGGGDLAYVKAIVLEDRAAYALHGAEGSQLAVFADRELAFATARQNDLEPVSVH